MKFSQIYFISWVLFPGILMFSDPFESFAQEDGFTVKGSIFSTETGLPLEDINVIARNSITDPASSDSLGKFELILPDKNEQIIVSYPGYKTQTIYVNGREELNIWLLSSDDISVSDDIPLIFEDIPGDDLTGSVTAGRNLEQEYTPAQSFDQVLQGKISGLHVINRSGMPGEGAFMHLRGYHSLFSSGLPLVVIDGMISRSEGFPNSIVHGSYQSPSAFLDLNDISSITFLKDATETALYGIKGSNGVLLINTHPPVGGKTTLDVSVYGGIATFEKQIPVMEAGPYKSYLMEQMYDGGMMSEDIFENFPFLEDDPGYLNFQKYNNNTAWQDEVFHSGILTDAYLRVKGGDARAKYSLSGGYLRQEGIVNNTSYGRFNFRFNSLVNVSTKVNIGINLGFTNGKYVLAETGALYQTNPLYASLIKSPNMTIYQQNQEGINLPVYEDILDFGFSNPTVLVNNVDATANNSRFIGSSYLNYDFTNHLSARINIGLNRDKGNERLFVPAWGVAPQEDGSAERSMKNKVDQYTSLLNENRITYSNVFDYIHDFSFNIGMRFMFNRMAQDYGLAQNSATDEFKNLNAGKSDERSVGGFDEKWNWLSYFASTRYKLLDRYILTLSVSMDGSSRFGTEVEDGYQMGGYPFVVLPAIGAAWRISGEPFMQQIGFIDEFKIRASYGFTGSDDFGNYASKFYYQSIPYYSVSGYYIGGISNPALHWETIKQSNIGFDLAVMKERMIFNIDFYKSTTEDMITYVDLPAYYGYEQFVSNGGECMNKGYDLNLYWRILNGTFKWEIDVSYSKYKNEIINLDNDPIITQFTGGEKISTTGQPFGMFYGYQSLGVFTTQAEADDANLVDKAGRRFNAGDIHFADLDTNNVINELDKTIIGNPHPDYIAGLYNRFSYKNFSLATHIVVVQGNDVFNYMRSKIEEMTGYENQSTAVFTRWRVDGHNTSIPRASYGDPMGNARFSNRWLEDGSFIRLREVTLSYTYPQNLAFLTGFTVFVSGTNLVTWTKYLGYDPEYSYADGVLRQGIDYGKMPQPRSVIIGLRIGL